jgi:membrane protein
VHLWRIVKRTASETWDDDCLGLAAQLAYYFILALFPALLFLLALASFFPLIQLTDEVGNGLSRFAPPEVIRLITEQMTRISNADNGGLLTLGVLGALWSSSSAMVSLIYALNTAYDITEGRSWWKVRLLAIGLTVLLAVDLLVSSTLIVAGPVIAQRLAESFGFASLVTMAWNVLQWPVAILLTMAGVGIVYYYGPDKKQDKMAILPGAILATLLWLLISSGFRAYIQWSGGYDATYGTLGGFIVLLLWLYFSGFAILVGAELNSEIENGAAPDQDSVAVGAR